MVIEAFAGPHDYIGGKMSGLYDEQGNAKRGRSELQQKVHEMGSAAALLPAAPFADAELTPTEVWKALDTLLKILK